MKIVKQLKVFEVVKKIRKLHKNLINFTIYD